MSRAAGPARARRGLRGGPARRAAERGRRRPRRGQGGVHPPAGRGGAAHGRARPASCPAAWIPQLGDAEELLALLGDDQPPRAPVLVPNLRGLERALACGVREVAVFASATETFARRNLNRTVAESLEMFAPVVDRARAAGLPVRGYVSMCFGDPWEGDGPARAGRGRRGAAGRAGLHRGEPGRHHRRRHPGTGRPAARPARRARPGHRPARRCTSTTPTVRRWPTPSSRCSPA